MSTGPCFASFRDWNEPINVEFPSRHAVAHGKYEPGLLTKENGVRSLLLLDARVTTLSVIRDPDAQSDALGTLDEELPEPPASA